MNNEHARGAQTPGSQTPQEDQNRKVLRIAGIILIIVVILAVAGNRFWKHKVAPAKSTATTSDQLPEGCTPGALFSATTGKPCPQPVTMTTPTETAATTAAPSGYEEAIHMYGGKVIIFDANCKALPENPTFAAGTRILVANNSAVSLALSVADKSKQLAPYHYFTVSLAVPGSAVVTCNGAPATTVTVQ